MCVCWLENGKASKVIDGKPIEERPLEKPKRNCQDNIKMGIE